MYQYFSICLDHIYFYKEYNQFPPHSHGFKNQNYPHH